MAKKVRVAFSFPVPEEDPRPGGSILFVSPLGSMEEEVHVFDDPPSKRCHVGNQGHGVKPAQGRWNPTYGTASPNYPSNAPAWREGREGEDEADSGE